ncbi:unnamed protein product [Owenia fusiformis]|uniref:Uncharacterized protein n=1 Tax=Owenia fusiformis TaxID=6347 RepID=A0A8J1UQG2_OWEFU|nr:unnamed protein product [Owenia fusiformis]
MGIDNGKCCNEEEREETYPHVLPGFELKYGVDDAPAWYLSILLGFQTYLIMFGATLALPFLLAEHLCITDDYVALSELISTIFFCSGIATLLQTTFGVRLPIIQGGTYTFLAPAIAILSLDEYRCPLSPPSSTGNITANTEEMVTTGINLTTTGHDNREDFMARLRVLQGSIMLASLLQIFVGFSGIIGLMLQFIGPLTIAPTIALIGISLFESGYGFAAKQWWIAITTMALIAIFSQYIPRYAQKYVPSSSTGQTKCKLFLSFFELFPIVLAIIICWIICAVLTASGALPDKPNQWGYEARTDIRLQVLNDAQWFRFPYPGQWGVPTVNISGVLGMIAGVIASMIESVGDYYTCARLAGAPPPPTSAINRGIGMEGVATLLAGAWGSGNGTTSYGENIGAIGITKVGSRRVAQWGALCMLILAILGKFGALFVTIPDPIIGGVFFVVFGFVTAVGLSNLQFVDMNSPRNLFIIGCALFTGFTIPQWLKQNPGAIATGSEVADNIFTVLFRTSMFVGGLVGFVLDNSIPGTDKERGISQWKQQTSDDDPTVSDLLVMYDMPFGMDFIKKHRFFQYLPFSPTFKGYTCCRSDANQSDIAIDNISVSTKRFDSVETVATNITIDDRNGNTIL